MAGFIPAFESNDVKVFDEMPHPSGRMGEGASEAGKEFNGGRREHMILSRSPGPWILAPNYWERTQRVW
ncbi:hypothetical protein SDJN02_01325, partial [Cucurbita argyrosperma subsp. argyrosperma]